MIFDSKYISRKRKVAFNRSIFLKLLVSSRDQSKILSQVWKKQSKQNGPWSKRHVQGAWLSLRVVESEVLSSDSDSGQFRLSDSNSDSGPTPTFSCITYL